MFLILVVLLICSGITYAADRRRHRPRQWLRRQAYRRCSPRRSAAKALRGNSDALGMIQGDAARLAAAQADLRRAAEALERLAKGV